MKTNFQGLFCFLIFFASFSMMGQTDYWTKTTQEKVSKKEKVQRAVQPEKYLLYQLDLNKFKSILQDAPLQGNLTGKSNFILSFPMPKGNFERFRVVESPIMAPELAAKFPMIKTYKAVGIDDPTATMRFSVTQYGLHSMLLSGKRSTVYIDPYTTDAKAYIVYDKASMGAQKQAFVCYTDQEAELPSLENKIASPMNDTDDQILRTYRLALSCTAEYGNYFGTNPGTELADIQAAMVIAINRVNEVYERDLAIRLEFVANNDQIIYFGSTSSDPWNGEWNSTTQNVTDNIIGSANYDIGHNFNRTGGGNAGCIGCVCINGQKGSGFTGLPNPVGDPFYIDYVAHEMGHQFGGYHTMNVCNRSGNGMTEVEPGSGSTIMGYAGICLTNIQPQSDAYFHYVNIRDISANIQPGGNSSCGAQTTLTNQPPVANAGSDYTIPKSTAYVLKGTATDPDGLGTLTYTWEQNDPEEAPNNGLPNPNWTVGPLYRSVMPDPSPNRYMPKLSFVLLNNLTPTWEVTPAVARTMEFAFVARDNGSGLPLAIGQTDSDLMEITVAGNAGPFMVTSQNTSGVVWDVGSNQTITWDVANTSIAPVNTSNVNILLSTDGGATFATALASNVPNDGSETITVPSVGTTSNARIMVEAVGNLFYAVNTDEFTVQEAEFVMNFSELEESTCQPNDIVFNFTYNTFNSFSETTTFSTINLPAGLTATFSPATATANATAVQLTISNTGAVAVGNYPISVVGTATSVTKSVDITLNIRNSTIAPVVLSTPIDGATTVPLLPSYTWQENPNAATYDIEIATDNAFTNIIETASVATTSYLATTALNPATTYYWRVRAVNPCGTGNYSSVFSFTTITCQSCSSSGNMDYATSTTLVKFNTINNASGKPSGYSDYTNISTDVYISHTYDLTVNVNTDGNFSAVTKVWIDWNQNCSFNDPGEAYNLGSATNTSNGPTSASPLSITVPAAAVVGTTTMRVSTKFNAIATSCETNFDGEVEDYTLDVGIFSVAENSFESFKVWPNPNNGEFSIELRSSSSEPVQVSIYDIRGRKIYHQEFENTIHFNQQINLNKVQSGLYILKVSDGKSNAVKKLVVK